MLSFRPLLQLVDTLLVMGTLGKITSRENSMLNNNSFRFFLLKTEVTDIQQLLRLIDPTSFGFENEESFSEGLLQMTLDEPVKLQLCHILQHLCDYQLQYRIESLIAFSDDFVGRLQGVNRFEISFV